jgi:alkylhydroperoxidase family enzyme
MNIPAATLGQIAASAAAALSDDRRATVERAADAGHLDSRVLATLAHAPGRLELFLDFYGSLISASFGDPRLKGVIHRRVGELAELLARHELPRHGELEPPAGLSADALALVRFIDAFAIDHQAIGPEIYDGLREHFSYSEMTELLWAVAIVRASARVGAAIGLPPVGR